jgi:hypothetical protein
MVFAAASMEYMTENMAARCNGMEILPLGKMYTIAMIKYTKGNMTEILNKVMLILFDLAIIF